MTGYRCRTCNAWHEERPTCFGAEMPDIVGALSDEERGARVELSSDQCVLDGEHFFLLGNLDIPIRGTDESLRFTVWTTLSAASYARVSELWETPGREREAPYFGWLQNHVPGYPSSVSIKTLVHTQEVGLRPRIEVIDEAHPLAVDQREGITEERAGDIVHAALHG